MQHPSAKKSMKASLGSEIIVKHCPLVITVCYECMPANVNIIQAGKQNELLESVENKAEKMSIRGTNFTN